MSYPEIINKHEEKLLRRKSNKEEISQTLIFAPVDWDADEVNKRFFALLVREKLATRAEIAAARVHSRVTKLLGSYPETCCAYVAAYAEHQQATVTYDGQISVVDSRGLLGCKIISDYQTEARVFAAEYRLPFAREAINDAVQVWFEDSRTGRLDVIRAQLAPSASFDWPELARRCFDCSTVPAEVIAAILMKFLHQAKGKLYGLPVRDHLMPVLLGPQGCGKSWFLYWLTMPIAELRRDTDFKAIADERNIGLWSSYVLIVDEMAYADKSDVETVKHVITADVLDRRPMRRNNTVRVPQRATLIGASNKSISELVRDETGARRFIGLDYRPDADWEYLNSLNALDAWRSVSEHDPDPLIPYRRQIADVQAAERHVSPVEAWLETLSPEGNRAKLSEHGPVAALDLYGDYLVHFRDRNEGHRPKSLSAWEQEVGRLLKAAKRPYRIEKLRTKAGVQWRWCDQVEGGRR